MPQCQVLGEIEIQNVVFKLWKSSSFDLSSRFQKFVKTFSVVVVISRIFPNSKVSEKFTKHNDNLMQFHGFFKDKVSGKNREITTSCHLANFLLGFRLMKLKV